MACHLSHKLPWEIIHDLVKLFPDFDARVQLIRPPYRVHLTAEHEKKLGHFARCLVSALKEFEATDKSSEDEWKFYDPRSWGNQRDHGAGAWPGFYETLPIGYLILNRILTVPERFERQCRDGSLPHVEDMYLGLLLGCCDGCHPEEFADHLGQVFERPGDVKSIKPLTPERLKIIKRHAGWLFRSMYSISGDNNLLDSEAMASQFKYYYFERS